MKARMKKNVFLLTGLLVLMIVCPVWGKLISSRDKEGNIIVKEVKEEIVKEYKCPPLPEGIVIDEETLKKLCAGKIPSTTVEVQKKRPAKLYPWPEQEVKITKNKVIIVNGNWGIIPLGTKTDKEKDIFLGIILYFICCCILIISMINMLSKDTKTEYLFVFYCSVFMGIIANLIVTKFTDASIGEFAGILAGGLAGLYTGEFAGGLADKFTGGFVGGLAGMSAGGLADKFTGGFPQYPLMEEYVIFLLLAILVCFIFSCLVRSIKFKGLEKNG